MDYKSIYGDIRIPKCLSAEEIIEIYKTPYDINKEVMNVLIKSNLKLVIFIVAKYYVDVTHIEAADLVAVGNIGLIKAIKNFSIKRGSAFSSCAAKYILNEINAYLRKRDNKDNFNISLNSVIQTDVNGNEMILADIIADVNSAIDDDKNDTYSEIRQALNILDPIEKLVVKLIHGFDCKKHTNKEVTAIIGVKQPQVSRIHARAREKLKIYIKDYIFGDKKIPIEQQTTNIEELPVEEETENIKDLLYLFPGFSKKQIINAINKLKQQQREVFLLRYPIDNTKKLKLDEIAIKIGTYKQAVFNILKEACNDVLNILNNKNEINEAECLCNMFPECSLEEILSVIKNLKENNRIIFEIKYDVYGYEIMKNKEVAKILNVTSAVVATRLNYSKHVIRKQLDELVLNDCEKVMKKEI